MALALAAVLAGGVLAACGGGSSAADIESADIVEQVPFSDGERLVYQLRDDRGVLGKGTLTVTRDGADFVLKQEYEEATPPEGERPSSDRSTAVVDAATLQPRSVERVVQGREETKTYRGAYASDGTTVTMTRDDGREREVELPQHAYENESSLWLWRTLAFAEDFEAQYVSVNSVERKRQTVAIEVTGQQRITVPAGTFETWRLQIRNGRATRIAWINIEAPHEIVQWDNGDTVFLLAETR